MNARQRQEAIRELSVGQAFLRWRKEERLQDVLPDPAQMEILFRAFQSGYVFGVNQIGQAAIGPSVTAEKNP